LPEEKENAMLASSSSRVRRVRPGRGFESDHWPPSRFAFVLAALLLGAVHAPPSVAQNLSAGTIHGQVWIPPAPPSLGPPLKSKTRAQCRDRFTGQLEFDNIPFNPYHLSVTAHGFQAAAQDVDVRSPVPIPLKISLKIGTAATTVTVTAESKDLIELTPTNHTDVDRALFDKVPLESASSSVSSLVTLTTPGVAADSNGLFHGMGDHNEVSFSVDNQPITDQQSKIFSNQIPLDSVESLEVIPGAPPADYGDKTSVVIKATSRSGQGMTPLTGASVLPTVPLARRWKTFSSVTAARSREFHLGQRSELFAFSRPAGVHRAARQGQ
jgi:TonB-dependent Receptor Plug Domain